MSSTCKRRSRQRGASAVEFALVFPVLFMVIYSGIVYGFMYFQQQRINFAVQEGLRAAIAVDPSGLSQSAYTSAVNTTAVTAALATFTAGGGTLPTGLTAAPVPPAGGTNYFALQVTYPVATLFPTVSLPLPNGTLVTFPVLPASLNAMAEGRLS